MLQQLKRFAEAGGATSQLQGEVLHVLCLQLIVLQTEYVQLHVTVYCIHITKYFLNLSKSFDSALSGPRD